MTNAPKDHATKAKEFREAAKRARLFVFFGIGSDADGMYLRFAEEQEGRAANLEAATRPPLPGQGAVEQSEPGSRTKLIQGQAGPLEGC